MPNPSIFNFNDDAVRIAFTPSDEPLFCLADVCKALNIQNQNPNRFNLNSGGLHKMSLPTTSGIQDITFIDEPNLYRIVFRSNKPKAVAFQNWVFEDVLPSIRKTGAYNRKNAYEELQRLHMQAKVQKEKGSFHGTGLNAHKHAIHAIDARIAQCESNLQIAFKEV